MATHTAFMKVFDATLSGRPPEFNVAADFVEHGAAFDDFISSTRRLHLDAGELGPVVGLSSATIHRRKRAGTISGIQVDGLFRVARMMALATTVFGTQEKALAWMKKPRAALGGRVPLGLLEHETTGREVEALLQRIAQGIVS